MAVPKTQRGKDRREQILRAAETVFGELGYSEASISEITRQAGTAQGTFYIYFDSKEAAFSELVAEMGRMTRTVLSEAAAGAGDRLEAEHLGLRAFLRFVAERPALYRIVEEARFVDPAAYRDYFTGFAAAYARQLQRAADAGEIRPGDAEVRAWALMGMAKSLGERFALQRSTDGLDAVAEQAYRLIRDGLEGPR